MESFSGKTAVVTGAASGIGFALAERFAREGMRVVLADIEGAALDSAVARITATGAEAIGVVTDVSKEADVASLAERARSEFGGVHVACNNAGVFAGGLLWEESLADYQWLMDVNIWGVIHGIRTFIPIMLEQDTDCHLVNTASMAGLCAMPFAGIYHMTKHAVLALSESLYHELELSSEKVKVSVLCPELIKTGIGTCERNRPTEYSKPGDIVESDARQLVFDSINEGIQTGVDPSVMADRVIAAIRSDTFYILSEDGWRETAHQRMEDIRTSQNPVLAPPV
jgi:NAD(P)-dependent dehydrogenase (short-subunit alcohol dehydrogenase family)